jgi:hypothetical protein
VVTTPGLRSTLAKSYTVAGLALDLGEVLHGELDLGGGGRRRDEREKRREAQGKRCGCLAA